MQKITPCLWFDGRAEEAVKFYTSISPNSKIDDYWGKLLEGGAPQQCGWLTGRFGLSWQVVPTVLPEMLQDKNPQKSRRVMEALLKMVKLDIKALKQAYEQG